MDNIVLGIAWFILLGFLPGFVLISIFKLKEVDWVKGLLYTIGLSVVFDMVVGFVINLVYPMFGILPFAPTTLKWTWVSIMAIFTVIVIFREKHLLKTYKWDNQWKIIIPIYIMSVVLIYQSSLLTNNLFGSDIHLEYYYSHKTIIDGFVNISTSTPINVCLPITILLPMYSILSGLDIMWVFKVIQPLILAILPIILYKIYKLQFGKLVSILSVIFFITLPFFTMDIAQLIRQQYAMIYFALVALILIDHNIGTTTKIILGSIFGVGVAISHYGVGVGFVCYMLIGTLVIIVLKNKLFNRLWEFIIRHKIPTDISLKPLKSIIAWLTIAAFCLCGASLYYFNVGEGVGINFAANIPIDITKSTIDSVIIITPPKPATTTDKVPTVTDTTQTISLSSDWKQYLDLAKRDPLLKTVIGFDFADAYPLGKTWRIIQYLVELCIIVGLIRLFIRPMPRIQTEFLVFIITSAFVVLGMYTLPTNGFGMGSMRVFVVTLMFLSPFFVFGVDTIAKGIIYLLKIPWKTHYLSVATAIILIPYILFNSGIVFELTKSTKIDKLDIPFSIALSSYRLDMTALFTDEDTEAMEWLLKNVSVEYPMFVSWHSSQLVFQYKGEGYNNTLHSIEEFCDYGQGYVYLRKWCVEHQTLTTGTSYGCRVSVPWLDFGNGCKPMKQILEKGIVVFDNGARIIKVTK